MKRAIKSWIVAYDVSDPKRLARLHRLLRRHALPLQFSLFLAHADDTGVRALMQKIAPLIDLREDDVRAYRVPARLEVSMLGRHSGHEDVALLGGGFAPWPASETDNVSGAQTPPTPTMPAPPKQA